MALDWEKIIIIDDDEVIEGEDETVMIFASGVPGESASVEVVETVTLDPLEDADVENVGDSRNVKLKFKIPRGQSGVWGGIGGTLEDQADLKQALDAKADIIHTSASGSLVHITDGAAYPVDSLSVGIDPVQDLHGYDNPWPAGGGVNLLPWFATEQTYTDHGVTVKCKTDGTVTITGTLDSGTTYFHSFDLPSGVAVDPSTYIHYMNTSIQANISVGFRNLSDTSLGSSTLDSLNKIYAFSSSGTVTKITIFTNATVELNMTFRPMICKTDTATSYAPYSNICPISGHTSATVTRTGKNLVDITKSESGGIDSSGVEIVTADNWRCNEFIPIASNTVYTLFSTAPVTRLYFYDANYNFISPRQQASYDKVTATSPANAKYAKWTIYIPNTTVTYADAIASKIQLELGSTATTWTAYQPIQQITIALGDTYYGAQLDAVAGTLTVDRASFTFTGIDAENWVTYNNGKRMESSYYGSQIKRNSSSNTLTGAISNAFQEITSGQSWTASKVGFSINDSNNIIAVSQFIDGGMTVENWKTYLQSNPLTIIAYLATPISVSLTPAQMSLLLGENNVWSDTGNTEVTYIADSKMYIDKKFAELQALILEN